MLSTSLGAPSPDKFDAGSLAFGHTTVIKIRNRVVLTNNLTGTAVAGL